MQKGRNKHQFEYEYLLHHVVLPRTLPDEYPVNQEELELRLLKQFVENLENCSKWIPSATVRLFQSLRQTHETRTPDNITEEINQLQRGDAFAMFVRQQNTGLLIYMPQEQSNDNGIEDLNIVTFPGNLNLGNVYNHPSDFMVTYPSQALKVKCSQMVRSQEFASQLCKLYNTLQTKNPKQDYVNTWLTTVLSDMDTTVANFPTITKKVRDEAIGMSDSQQSYIDPNITMCKGNYFRRSSFYMAIKVLLQLSLTAGMGEERGRFIYKLIMLNFMAAFCEKFESPNSFSTLNADLMRQFLAKMARRIEKLSLMKSGHIETNIFSDVVNKTKCTISNIRIKIDHQLQRIHIKSKCFPKLIRLSDPLNFQADIYQKIRYLRPYLEKRKSSNAKKDIYSVKLHFKAFKRHDIRHKTPPSMKSFDDCVEEIERHLILADFENWVLYGNMDSSKDRLKWARKYIRVPEEFHTGDPFGISKMVLVRLKLIAMIDRIATEKYPLLFEHRSGIDPAVFDVLAFPQLIDKKIALELQNYFTQRNANALYPGLIEHDTVLSSSFPVRFAMQSDEMQAARREIHEKARERIEQKRGEWEEGRATVKRLRKIARTMLHDHSDGEEILKHDIDCQLCELQDKINRVKIDQYEYALPQNEDEQNSIVFELRIPPEIATLRDVLHYITRLRLNRFERVGPIIEDWIEKDQLYEYNQSGSKWSRGIHLGCKKSISVDSLHVDNDFSYFVVKNSSNCLYHVCYLRIFPSIDVGEIKEQCTLNLSPCYPYGIGWQGESKTAFQIQNESKKPQKLLQFELHGLGTLRADDQIRKLYGIIETETLSFDQHSALGSILQPIWKMGTISDDFVDLDITNAVIELLEKFIEIQKENWAKPIQLLLITFITVRIYELNANESTADQLVDVLNKIRDVTIDWYGKIQKKLNKLENPTLANEQLLRLLLVTASITGAMTFFVNSKHRFFTKIFKTNPLNGCTALRTWLLSIITLNRNILLEGQVLTKSTSILRMLVRLVRYTGIHIEWKIRDMIRKDPSDVFELIKEQWPPPVEVELKEFNFSEKCPQVFLVYVEIEEITKHVTIDVITGSFLVNNLPIARLPENITSNPLFRRVFGGSILEVTPDTRNNFISTHKYNEISYEFGWINVTELIITEHGKDGFERELILDNNLRNDFPELMVENYSHWWCKQMNLIEFRPKIFESKPFSETSITEFTLNVNMCHLVQNETNACMLDVNSKSYKRIQDYANRLEFYMYIHVFVKDNIATAEMARLKLKFIIDKSKPNTDGCYDLMSKEFPGMRISLQNDCGTLYGLNEGLLLEKVPNKNSQSSSKLLLLPYARISSTYEYPNLHAGVYINIYCSENPPFHQYQVDETMRQLKPCDNSPSAWIYLAYLHAATSHGEVEPLTGMSGTERALQILQSNAVRSSTPYAPDVVKILKLIWNLSTERNLNESSQSVVESDWPHPVPDHCSQDSFLFIAHELMKDGQCLNELHNNSEGIFASIDRKYPELNRRSYLRCLQLQPNLRVDDAFIDHNNDSQKTLPQIPLISYSADARLISSLHHANAFAVPENFDLKEFLTNSRELDGLIHVENVLHILDHNVYESLTNMWLSLYEVARKQILSRQEFGLICSLLSHENTNDEQFKAVLALQAIACNPDQFMGSDYDPPSFDNYEIVEGLFDPEKVSKILKSCYLKPEDFSNDEKWSSADRDKYEEKVSSDIKELTKFVASHWSCNNINLESAEFIKSTDILLSQANSKLNVKLRIWNNNRNLFDFIEKIEGKLRKIHLSTVIIKPSDLNITHSQALKSHPKYEINFETVMLANIKTIIKIPEETSKVWLENGDSNRSALEWWAIYEHAVYSKENKHLVDAGMFPRMIPSLVLPRITSKRTNSKLKEIIGVLAISIARNQWLNRIKTFERQSELELTLDQELNNEPHINWKPCEHPEWLLFEIDQNVTIHQDQIEIAKQMIDSTYTGTKDSVNQLYVDDRQTDVVLSILALYFADGKQACEITVPKLHFATYLNLLRKNLGGMLNKRIYTLPYRHDIPTKDYIQELLNIYQECQREKGVILTLTDSQLNSQLEIFNSIHKDDINNLRFSSNIHEWINANVRSIFLSESDA